MTYTPQTWVDNNASYPLSAARMNYIESGIEGLSDDLYAAPSTWSPVVTQSSTVTSTTTDANYFQIGNIIWGWFFVSIGGAGVTNNTVTVTLPTTVSSSMTQYAHIGSATIRDASTGTTYSSSISLFNLTDKTVAFQGDWSAGGFYGTNPNLALASGDFIRGSFMYIPA